ncbi:methyl-accepting chemotaxis sensory transducer [Geomonas limicola]|uniref:Methyl-accepting chemotaxis sensory transducer n=1 Tax=Geomonas limicola TaxID=2740186 RepID=A0A6V8NAJ2_9BACT|nr:methyl-accepting chemotaxis protein [Geomonas limicola]GFO69531.1 methyl-accepting chemotaxis sensory transducer [Geomonas limicola]
MFKNLKIKTKLLLMLLVPIVGLFMLSIREVRESYTVLGNVTAVKELTGLAVRTGSLVHEIQKERGFSTGFLNAKGEKFRDDLLRQRGAVDAETGKLKEYLAAHHEALSIVRKPLEDAESALGKLAETRNAIDQQKISGPEAFTFYTALVRNHLDVMGAVVTASNHQKIMRLATGYYAFVQAKEEAGKERATLNAVLAAGAFDDEKLQRLLTVLASQINNLDLFRKFASPDQVAAFEEQAKTPTFQKVEELRNAILAKSSAGGFDTTPEVWFGTSTEKINAMKGIEDRLASEIVKTADQLAGQAKGSLSFNLCFSAVVIAIALTVGFLVFINITRPLARMLTILKDIAEGDGDLTHRLEVDRKDEIGEVSLWFNRFVDNVHGIVAQVAGNTSEITQSASLLSSTAEQIATAAEEVSHQSAVVATASEEMSATSRDISHNCLTTAEVSDRAGATGRNGAQVVQAALQGMQEIAECVQEVARMVERLGARSDQIGAIVGTIQDIADQTNLLALNAAIEAARAGEQGRGFAVVADEVRALAERTTRATREIGTMIVAIQDETSQAVRSMEDGVKEVEQGMESSRQSGVALKEILGAIDEVASQVQQIATTAEEQTAVTGEITGNIHQITEVISETARGAHQTAAAASQLSVLAQSLQRIVNRFKLDSSRIY